MLRVSVVTTPITPSRSFSVEILTGLTLSWKMEYPEGCSTTMEGRLVWFRGGITVGM